jgi:Flp pilus assembly protein TadB
MPQRQRRRKHKGTQAGTIRHRARPSRAQARASAERDRRERQNRPPTWRGSIIRGAIAAAALCLLLILIVGAPIGGAISLSLVAGAVYVPAFHLVDSALYRRRMARRQQSDT